jgi:hypothetical protein
MVAGEHCCKNSSEKDLIVNIKLIVKMMQALRNFDVEYFVVDLESTTQRNWSPFGEVLYQNHSFAFLQLRSDQSDYLAQKCAITLFLNFPIFIVGKP